MARFEEGKLKKKQYLLTLYVFLGICLVSLILLLILSQTNKNTGRKVRIMQGNVIIKEIYIDNARDQKFTIECDEGYNIIQIKDHEISVIEADCPDQICVMMGNLTEGYIPVVCLPHYLVIEFVEEVEEE